MRALLILAMAAGCSADEVPFPGSAGGEGDPTCPEGAPSADGACDPGQGEGEGEPPCPEGTRSADGECHPSQGEEPPVDVSLSIEPAQTRAGSPTVATCVGGDISVEPAGGVQIEASVLTATLIGEYIVTCAGPGGEATAPWTVVPGPVTRLRMTELEQVVEDGGAAHPVIEAADAYENPVAPKPTYRFRDPGFEARGRFDGSVVGLERADRPRG